MKKGQILSLLVVLMFIFTGISSAQITDVDAYREVIADIHDYPEAFPNVGDLDMDSSLTAGSFETDLTASWEDGLCRAIHSSDIEVLDQTINISASLSGEISRSADGAPNIFESISLVDISFYTAGTFYLWVEHLREGTYSNSHVWLFDEGTSDVLYYLNAEEEDGIWMGSYTGTGHYRLQIMHHLEATSGSEFAASGSMDLSLILSTDEVVSTDEKSWTAVKALYR